MPENIRFILAAVLMAAGIFFIAAGIFGIYKFKFVLNRMHAAAMVDTLGLFLILAGLAVACSSMEYIPKLCLILLFQWIGSPIASHFVGRLEVDTDQEIARYMETEHDEEKEQS